MRYRRFLGVDVSEVGLGAWTIGNDLYGKIDEETARRIVKRAVDLGINIFDTADMYGRGKSEELLGEWLEGYDVHVTTKVGYDFYGREKPQRNFDAEYLERAVAMSYRRLRRRPLLVQAHNPGIGDVERAYAALRGLRGTYFDHLGVALGPEVNVYEEGLAALGVGYESIMLVFNILEQEPGHTLIGLANILGRGIMVRVPHASEVLTDRFTPEFPPHDHRSLRPREWLLRARRLVENGVKPLAGELGYTLGQYALKFILSFPVSTVLVTVLSPEELEEYAAASDGKALPEHHVRELVALYLSHRADLR